MSEIKMNRIAKKMYGEYKAIERYLEITKHGDVGKLYRTVSLAFGLSPRTTKERLEMLESANVFQTNGYTWKFLSNDDDCAALLACLKVSDNEERVKYRAPQEV